MAQTIGAIRRAVAALMAVAFALPAAAQRGPDNRPGIAVLPFAQGIAIGADREVLDALSVGLQEILITDLAQNPALRVVDRSVIRDLIAEQDLGASGRVDERTAAKLGKIVGARYVFTGGFNDVGKEFRLDGRIVEVETGEIIKAEQVSGNRDDLFDIVTDMGRRITRRLNLPPLAEPAQREREVRGAKIPREAVILFSQAQYFHDRGNTDRAKALYERITKEYPGLSEAREALRRLEHPDR